MLVYVDLKKELLECTKILYCILRNGARLVYKGLAISLAYPSGVGGEVFYLFI
jgi:hypothetical protein